jgi:5,10-methylenetetrahydromethanopterin reductase
MRISCALPSSSNVPDLGRLAERLGYFRLWCYDSPALYGDVWVALARLAERTDRIGLGPGVLVPSLRHPMVNAAAIATVADLAPGRLAVAIGSGFTGRLALGQRPVPWRDVEAYVRVLRSLLAGEDASWEGAVVRMLHGPGMGAARPVEVPILIGADGPKGLAVAAVVGDGVISARPLEAAAPLPWRAVMQWGTVLDPGEDLTDARVLAAAAPGAVIAYHATYALRGAGAVQRLPGGDRWLEVVEAAPEATRHLAVHEGHAVASNDADRRIAQDSRALWSRGLTGHADEIRRRADALDGLGVDEVVYQPAGPDLARELRAMAAALEVNGEEC